MKRFSLCVTGLLVAPLSVHGFVVPGRAGILEPRVSSSGGNGFVAARTQRRVDWAGSRSRSRVQPLDMIKPDFSKTLGVVLIVGSTIAVSAIPMLSMGPQSSGPKTVRVVDEDGNTSERGIMTALTRPEIQKKLAQIPVFFLKDESGAVHVENGEGLFFMSPGDAKEKLQELKGTEGTKVAATTLDDIWFPLIKKKGLNKTPVGAEVSGLSDLSATYKIIPRSSQLSQAKESQGWKGVADAEGVPVWAAETLAFRGSGGKMKMPLFTNVDDLMTSWDRLETEAGSEPKSPTIQVSSIGAIIDIMQRGGGNNRNLEFFADMDAIEQAEKLL
eukprot:g14164.t1